MALGIVCGYRAEQRIAERISTLTAMGWKNPNAAKQLIEQGATMLLSFGVAAGLAPDLSPGDLLIPESVLVDGEQLLVSHDLHEHLMGEFTLARREFIADTPEIIVHAYDKRAMYARTDAIAADMESGMVARAAMEAGLAFAIIRAVSDPVDHTLPPAAVNALSDEGTIDLAKVLGSLIRNPLQLPDLIRTGEQNNAALDRLGLIAYDVKALLI